MPIRSPIASAVATWSPVIITTRIPAAWQSCMLCGTAARGGSKIPHKLKKQRPRSVLESSVSNESNLASALAAVSNCFTCGSLKGLTADKRLRRAHLAISLLAFSMRPRSESDNGSADTSKDPSVTLSILASFEVNLSGAPTTTARCVVPCGKTRPAALAKPLRSSGKRCTEADIFRAEEKGTERDVSSSVCNLFSSENPPFIAATFSATSVRLPSEVQIPSSCHTRASVEARWPQARWARASSPSTSAGGPLLLSALSLFLSRLEGLWPVLSMAALTSAVRSTSEKRPLVGSRPCRG
mmetsp:Transcript_47461/g.101511  ORF Transcript_47461/g.101511 Transcript_47461/m.101511 type:complete len:298 (-) Transcript_47461:1171-2064(-)